VGELDKLRNALDRLQTDDRKASQTRASGLLAMLPAISEPFSTIREEVTLEGLTIKSATGEALITVPKAGSMIEITGLDGNEAALRLRIDHAGLNLASSLIEDWNVPRRVVFDLRVSGLSTQALTSLLHALITITANDPGASSEDEGKTKNQQALEQALGAAAALNPIFHIYQIAIDTEQFGVDLTAEAKGSPLSPKGYIASADLAIRGFDAVPKLIDAMPLAEYFPVLREIGVEGTAPDGMPRLQFHLASTPANWITINGNDVVAWFDGTEAASGQPRVLRPSDPPMRGDDVKSVQRALAAANISVEQNGEYNSATAGAVARFQKETGINVSGVMDAVTRQRLLGLEDPLRRRGRN
jgi:Putative peptidoglycan binding domain